MTEESWFNECWRTSRRFRWGIRWERVKGFLGYWLWVWLFNRLVWDFNLKDEEGAASPRLMYARTRVYLATDDPRHFGDEP